MPDKKCRILYVEDQLEMIELMQLVLRQRPAQLIGATSVAQAIEILHNDPPDLVLLDIMIPEVDGWAVQSEIISNPALQHIPIIVITARGSLYERDRGLHREGVVDYIIKPFSPAALLVSIDRALANRPVPS